MASRMSWKERAACRDAEGDWVEITRQAVHLQREEKKHELSYCAVCEVRAECLEFGLLEPTAIYGGLMPKERRDLAKKPPTRNARCGSEAGYATHRRRNERPCRACSDANVRTTAERKRERRDLVKA